MSMTNWMCWEGGVDVVGSTVAGGAQPNVIVHVARMVHTPVGSAPSGMVFYQPDPGQPPVFAGFVSGNVRVGAYFGPHIFAGTPFENVPVLEAQIEVFDAPARARVRFGGFDVTSQLDDVGPFALINRAAGQPLPFAQQGLEAAAGRASVTVNGVAVPVHLLPMGIAGGASAVVSPAGIYAR